MAKGINLGNLLMTGPKFVIPEKKFIKFTVDSVSAEDLVNKYSKNNDKIKMISKFILGGAYQLRFLDYEL